MSAPSTVILHQRPRRFLVTWMKADTVVLSSAV
jgi:hypothetical protein